MSDGILTTQLSETELKRSYWFLTNVPFFKKLGLLFLVGIDCLLWLIVLGTLVNFYLIQYTDFRNVFRGYGVMVQKNPGLITQAKPLAIKQIGPLSTSNTTYDIYAEVRNDNTSWRADFNYLFTVNGQDLKTQKGFIMPGESKFFMQLSLDGPAPQGNIELHFSNLSWHHVAAADAAYLKNTNNFSIQDFKFTSSQESGISQTVPVSTASFTLVNNTGYSFWSVGLPIVLLDGGHVVGITYLGVENIMPSEKRPMEARWFESIGSVSSAEIVPSVNVFDKSVFRPVQGR